MGIFRFILLVIFIYFLLKYARYITSLFTSAYGKRKEHKAKKESDIGEYIEYEEVAD